MDSLAGKVMRAPGPPHHGLDERVSKTFRKAVRAGIHGLSEPTCRDMRFHDLRHTCAVTMLRGGAALHEVRDQLGHSSVQVTEKYSKYVPGSKDRAAAAMDRMISAEYAGGPIFNREVAL